MSRIFHMLQRALGPLEHQFLWSSNRVLLHFYRCPGGAWQLANWMDMGVGMEPVGVMRLMGQNARRMNRRERFLFWLYERGWRDEPI